MTVPVMPRLILLVLPLFLSTHAQHIAQLARIIQDQNHNHSHLVSLSLNNEFFSFDELLEVVDIARGDGLSPDCKEDMGALVKARLGIFEYPEFAEQVWMPMRDSAGKFHQAILKGHIYFAGHFSECVLINVKMTGRDRSFKADYFKIDVDAAFQPNVKNGSCQVSDLGAVIGWSFGVCLPASCSSAELESLFIAETAKHNPVCAVHRTNDSIDPLDAGFYVTVSIMGGIFALCISSGLADFFFSDFLSDKAVSKSLLWRLFMSFSLYSNVASIFDTSASKKDGQIAPIHCIRFFSMCWVVLGHMTGSVTSVIANPFDVLHLTKDLTTEFILNAYFSVDSFFFVGGLLLTFLWFKSFYRNPKQTNSRGAWLMFYIHRIIRLSAPYFMMILFYAFVLPQMYRDSPFNLNLLTQVDFCKETWWLEFTYLHNIIDSTKQCLGYNWYLATDMQIFFFTPIIIIPLALKPVIGFIVAAIIFAISSALNIFLVYHYHWPSTMSFIGASDPEMTDFEDYDLYMYMSPIIRCQVYIIGMLVGWFLQTKKRMRINPVINVTLWILTFALGLTLILGLHSQTTGTLIPIFWRSMYSAFSKPAWALVLSWIVISCYYGYGGPINSFMSWHIWVPLGRLSYCGYLVHYPIIYLTLSEIHDENYFSSFIDFVIRSLIPLIAITYFVSIFWSACFEISFGKMEMLLLGGHRMSALKTENLNKQRKPSNSKVEEDAEYGKIRL
ncbi:oac-39 [Pristionchus pacificus]|uniref:Acyltransferase n=1 Tax=Pristionchus pacificus TaxID=54126 RepID=A0A2A6CLW7_PRIPA|nr:oac-39 [Pristionchus pacificus]|eukprot:PDM79090.1 Acyltransferase [Pristionchus pacificus]